MSSLDLGRIGFLGPLGPRSDRYGTYGLGSDGWKIGAGAGYNLDTGPKIDVDYAKIAREVGASPEPRQQSSMPVAVSMHGRSFAPSTMQEEAQAAARTEEARAAMRAHLAREQERQAAAAAKAQADQRAATLARVRAAQAQLASAPSQAPVTPRPPAGPAQIAPASGGTQPFSLSIGSNGQFGYSSGMQDVDSWRPLGIVLVAGALALGAYVAFR